MEVVCKGVQRGLGPQLACLLLGSTGEGGESQNTPMMVGWWALAQGVKRLGKGQLEAGARTGN